MRIAVYGDSYAEKRHGPESGAWWHILKSFGHDVTCFAESSSSFIWSAQLVDRYAKKYDFNIWCTTAIGRHSIELSDRSWLHLSSGSFLDGLIQQEQDLEKLRTMSVFREYLKYIYRAADDDFVFKHLVEHFQKIYPNLMIIPGFPISNITKFHLYDVTVMEEKAVYDDLETLYDIYEDQRVCHMSRQNNMILANLVNNNLQGGIFQTDIKNFSTPTKISDLEFRKK